MIFTRLEQSIKSMKELRRLEILKANQEQQEKTDQKYKQLSIAVHSVVHILEYTHSNLQFTITPETADSLAALLKKMANAVSNGLADQDVVSEAEQDLRSIQLALKKEWAKHFSSITAATVGTLNVLRGLSVPEIATYLTKISSATAWSLNNSTFIGLKDALTGAEDLIHGLHLDPTIVDFLGKMNSGKANISDLNEDILSWIYSNHLEKKIKLSFSAK